MYHVYLQAMRAQPAERPTAEQMHRHAWLAACEPLGTTPIARLASAEESAACLREPLVITPVARLASAEEADAGALCVAQLAATLPCI